MITGLIPNTGLPSTSTASNFLDSNPTGPISLAGPAPTSTTMDANSIQNHSGALAVPTTPPALNPATPIIAGAQASQDAAEAQAEKNVTQENAGVTTSQNQTSGLMDQVKNLLGMQASAQTDRAQNQAPIDQANTDLTGINTQIANTNVKFRGVQDQIKERGDLSASAQQGLLDNANTIYGRQLADLAIRQSAANQNVESLTKAADEKLALTLAPIQSELSYYKDFALQNQANLTKSEQDKVGQIIAEKQTLITQTQTQETAKTSLLTTAMQAGVKLTDAQTQAVLNSPDATSAAAYLASQGVNLQPQSFSTVTNPITGAISSFNTKTGQFGGSIGGTPVSPSGMTPAGAPGSAVQVSPAATNQNFTANPTFQAQTPQAQNDLSGFLNYTKDINSVNRQQKSFYQNLISQIDPTWDAGKFQRIQNLKTQYQTGTESDQIVAANTAIQHIAELQKAFTALNNGDVHAVNAVTNSLKGQAGSGALSSVNLAVSAVSNELSKLYSGSSGTTDRAVSDWQKGINANMTPQEQKDAIATGLQLLFGKTNALNDKYKNVAGVNYPIFTGDSQTVLNQLGAVNPETQTQTQTTNNTTKGGLPFDYQGALKAGYTEAEIQGYLTSH